MRVDLGRFNWGLFLVIAGAIPLAHQQGALSTSSLSGAWGYWPLILIGIGLGIVLARTPVAFVGGLVVAACLGLVVGSLFAVGPNVGCGGPSTGTASASRSGGFEGTGTVTLRLQCGTAAITASTDSSWHVDASNDAGRTPTITSTSGTLTVTSDQGSWFGNRGRDNWQISLPNSGPVSLGASLDAGDARFSLAGTKLTSASFSLNLGTLHVDLGGASVGSLSLSTNLGAGWLELDGNSDLTGTISTNLGSVDVCAPASLGLQVKSSESLSSSDFGGLGMTKVGDYWQTPNYATAEHKANLTISTSLGSLKLHPAGGCK